MLAGLRPPTIQDRAIGYTVHSCFHSGRPRGLKRPNGVVEPNVYAARHGKTGGHVVIFNERHGDFIGDFACGSKNVPDELLATFVLWMCLATEDELNAPRPDVAEALEVTGLKDRREQLISTLSKGYRQRVGLAQAIVHKPDVLVLDEPTNGLDPMQIRAIRELIARLAKNSTIILSTHILQEIEAVCDRILVMIQGSLVADAPLDELVSSDGVAVSLAPELAGDERVVAKLGAVAGVRAVRRLGRTASVVMLESTKCNDRRG